MKNELKMESTLLKKIKFYYLLHNKFLSVTKIFRTRQNASLIIAASHMSCLLKKKKQNGLSFCVKAISTTSFCLFYRSYSISEICSSKLCLLLLLKSKRLSNLEMNPFRILSLLLENRSSLYTKRLACLQQERRSHLRRALCFSLS